MNPEGLRPYLADAGLSDRQLAQMSRLLSEREAMLGGEISEEEIRYHLHFWSQRLAKAPDAKLRLDDPKQIIYPATDQLSSWRSDCKRLSLVPTNLLFRCFVKNWQEVLQEFQAQRDKIGAVLQDKSLVIVTNHATWLNVPIIMLAVAKAWGIPKDQIYAVLGPALTTSEQMIRTPNSLGNLIKTVPDTLRGNVPGAENLIKEIRKSFTESLLNILKTPGRIVVLAPSGTTDLYDPKSDLISIQPPSKGSLTLLKMLNQRGGNGGVPLQVIGTNEVSIFHGNTHPRRGEEYLRLGQLFDPKTVSDPQAVMDDLALRIVDRHGSVIGRNMPREN